MGSTVLFLTGMLTVLLNRGIIVNEVRIMSEQMSLDDYKKKVKENLLAIVGEKTTRQIMEDYEDDFPQFLKDNWSVAGLTPALINYYV